MKACSPANGLDAAYDEMFELAGQARPHCRALFDDLRVATPADLGQRQMEADKAFLTQGITFTVYGDDQGTERIFPFDLLPRIIAAAEWQTLERGLTQRSRPRAGERVGADIRRADAGRRQLCVL